MRNAPSPLSPSAARQLLPQRRPVAAALLTCIVYAVSLPLWFLLPWEQWTGAVGNWIVTLGVDVIRIIVAVAFLTAWRLWRASGFLTAPTGRRIIPALPLLLLPAIPALFGPGLAIDQPWKLAAIAFGVATVAFGEEAVFRGVILRVLLSRGIRGAVFGSAALSD